MVATACGGSGGTGAGYRSRDITPAGARDSAVLTGSGSTFVEPLLREWISRYRALAPGVTINYEATSSVSAVDRFTADGRGANAAAAGPDFFTTEIPLTEVEAVTVGGSEEYMLVPWAAGAIAAVYNLPDVPELRLSPDTLGALFSGRIVRWDDPAVRAENPGARLPGLGVSVVYRADGSGTTSVFTSFLDAAGSGGWGLGKGANVAFPRGTGVRGSEAVAASVKRTAGAIGYVSLAEARRADVAVAHLGNRAGRFVAPTTEAVSAALGAATLRDSSTIADLLFTPESPGSYALATFTYLLVRRNGMDPAKEVALRHFATWAMSEGQRFGEPLGYTRVPLHYQVPSLTEVEEW